MIEVQTKREDYREVLEIVADEEGCEGLRDLFDTLPEHPIVRAMAVEVAEGSRELRIRFESRKVRQERERKEAERTAERAARVAADQEADRLRRTAGGTPLTEEDNA